jgi:magnesium-dependent phosphatase-1
MEYKLFVFDLDETLWSVSEGLCSLVLPPFQIPRPDRIENDRGFWVELKPGVRSLFEFLKGKGRYISIASRNDPGPTMDLLDALQLSRHLDFPQLAWRPKTDSIRRIIREIKKRDKVNIKPQEVFFLDDWPENVAPVRAWGAAAFIFGRDIETYDELLSLLK